MKWLLVLFTFAGCGSYVPCSAGMTQASVCVQCGPAGGCATQETKCVKTCSSAAECAMGAGESCSGGVCQLVGCR